MEGGDDMQLEPGEVVELVKVEGSGSLRVRTKDEHPFEGNIPAGFLRRKDSVRGGKMESESWYWVLPHTYSSLCMEDGHWKLGVWSHEMMT